jgi:hypothetical protein
MKGLLKLLAPLSSGALVVYLIARVSSCDDDPTREAMRQLAVRDAIRLRSEATLALQAPDPTLTLADRERLRAAAETAEYEEREILHGFLGGTKSPPPGNAYKQFVVREQHRQRSLHAHSGRTDEFQYSREAAFEHFNKERAKRRGGATEYEKRSKALLSSQPDELDRVLGTEFLYGTKAPANGLWRPEKPKQDRQRARKQAGRKKTVDAQEQSP